MIIESNEKLQEIRDRLVELIAEIDLVLEEVRTMRRRRLSSSVNSNGDGQDGASGEPEYVRRFARQRDLLMTAASMLADMRFEWSQDAEQPQEA